MAAAMLSWRTVTSSDQPNFSKAGTTLDQAIVPGTRSRFAIASVRKTRYVADAGAADGRGYVELECGYEVRDAETVTLAQVAAGVEPGCVFKSDSLDETIAWAKAQA